MIERSPFLPEQEIEEDIHEELSIILLAALLYAVDSITDSSLQAFSLVQSTFKSRSSEALPKLNEASYRAIKAGVDRASSELNLKNLSPDLSDQRISQSVISSFNRNLAYIIDTNQRFYESLIGISVERGWTDKETLKRLKQYYGLTPRYLKTVLAMESALVRSNVSKKRIDEILKKRTDELVESRMGLATVLITTGVVEGAKDASFEALADSGQIDRNKYVKEWVSVLDENTTDICVSSHKMEAEIGSIFANGFYHPPATSPPHSCRSSMRIKERK